MRRWWSSSDPASVVTTDSRTAVPTLSEWMLVALMGLLLVTGAALVKKRHARGTAG
jgi:hypothetical protein